MRFGGAQTAPAVAFRVGSFFYGWYLKKNTCEGMASAYANWFHFTDEVKVGACRCAWIQSARSEKGHCKICKGLCEIGTGLGKLTAWSWVELEISENVVSCRHSGSKPRRYIVIAFLSGFTRTSDEVVAPIILFIFFFGNMFHSLVVLFGGPHIE